MLPWTIRRRSCSGDESTSSIWSALRSTQSGTRSRTCTSRIRSTASAMLSRCWMLTVVMTSISASRSSITSCQRFSWRPEPGTLVWASSSTRTTCGWRSRTASRSISSKLRPPVVDDPPGDHLQVADQLLGALPAVALDEPDDHVGAPLLAPMALVQHGVGLAHPGSRPQVDTEPTGGLDRHRSPCVLLR